MTRQIERLRPAQIEQELAKRSLIYIPLGTIEWHCHHLPIGLDALTAHALCLCAADRAGGLVWPALYFGTGGDHGDFPWTVMMPEPTEIEAQIAFTLKRLAVFGVEDVVLFSGHFAETQLEMIDRIAARWNDAHVAPRVIALSVNRAIIPHFPPDHAGLFETTLLEGVAPGLPQLDALGDGLDTLDRFDPNSPLWGIIGTDPRLLPPLSPAQLVDAVVEWIIESV